MENFKNINPVYHKTTIINLKSEVPPQVLELKRPFLAL
jgi:hypothetical protein